MTGVKPLIREVFYHLPAVCVWGAGFIEEPDLGRQKLLRRLDVRACRGLHTLNLLKKINGAKVSENTVTADPGLLAGRLTDTSDIVKKYALGVIPHYVDKNNPLLSKIDVKDSTILDIQQSPETFIKTIAQCENVISSSLHGLIAADSLGIPSVRMILSDNIHGGDFKFNDYYSAFGMDSHDVINLARRKFTNRDLPGIKNNYKIKPETVMNLQNALLASFPFKRPGR